VDATWTPRHALWIRLLFFFIIIFFFFFVFFVFVVFFVFCSALPILLVERAMP
jgi:heme/copper-type cytochrome/quinol oxidase subunit 2